MVGGGTDNQAFAAIDPTTKQPVQNGARQVWISETALTNALNMSQLASQVSLFGIVVGIALLLSGIGFGILAAGGTLRNAEPALAFGKQPKLEKTPAVPVA
jgi:F0F1-type ATP synthase membrane subunit c/vacuolar-type H+-ATPase subunit K